MNKVLTFYFKYINAIKFLEGLKESVLIPPLQWSESLSKACDDHYQDISKTGSFSHVGSDKSSYKERIERHCRWGGSIFESLDFFPRSEPLEIVIAWLIDDGN